MSGLRSGAIVLLLAIPFGLYVAWQLNVYTRVDLAGTDAPAEKGLPTKDQLTDRKAKTEKWANDVRKAGAVAYQFRAPTADDTPTDEDCSALVRAAGVRSADLTDLEKFLSRIANPVFTGKLKDRYKGWYDETESLRVAASAIEAWFDDRTPVIDGQVAADDFTKKFNTLLEAYTKNNSIFMDRGAVAGWRVRLTARIIEGLSDAAKGPYKRVLDLPLPLPAEDKSADVRTAIGALREMKVQLERLDKAVNQAKTDNITLSDKAVAARSRATDTAKEWAAGDELLGLFADPELFTDPNKAASWLPKVQDQLNKTQTDAGRELIRKKVQQFCEAYVPKVAHLDSEVLLRGKKEPRASVTIEYDSDAKSQPLTDLPSTLNEFNFQKYHKNFDRIVWGMNGSLFTGIVDALQPTPKSVVARDFTQARADVTTWSLMTLTQLKMKCEGEGVQVKQEESRALLDELVGANAQKEKESGRKWTKENTRIATRLSALAGAMAKYPMLFEANR
jgi:hypothetical protein